MAFARPIVAFELLENRRSALDAAVYVQDNDVDAFAGAVRALLEDEARRRAMGAYGRARFERELAWEISAETLVSSYDRLFGHVVGR